MSNKSGQGAFIKSPYTKTHFVNQQQIDEFVACCDQVTGHLYFMDNFFYIQHPTKGSMVYHPWDYQKRLIHTYHNYRFSISLMPRQSGKCFGINTIVKIKNIHTGTVEEITIGKFYERFSNLSNLLNRDEGIALSSIQKTQYDSDQIQRSLSECINSVPAVTGSTIKKGIGFWKSCIPAWRETFSVFYKIYSRGYIGANSNQSRTVPKRKSITYYYSCILDESYESRRRTSDSYADRSTNYFFFEEMLRKIRGSQWVVKMARTAAKVVKEFQKTKLFKCLTKTIPFNNGTLCVRSSIFCDLGTVGYARLPKQGISAFIGFRKDCFTGFHQYSNEKNYRIRRDLLAWATYGEPATGTRKRTADYSKWIPVTKSCRGKIQERSSTGASRMSELSESVERKFIDSYEITDYEITTDTGWKPITHLHRTIPYNVWEIKTVTGLILQCADTHILFDGSMNQVFAKDLTIGSHIHTVNGIEKIKHIRETNNIENMFDLTIRDENHRFYSNGILSHNSTSAAGYLLWYAMFVPDSTILIAAHKYTGAQEIMQRIRYAYENCPNHIKAGVTTYNKGSLDFENGSRIVSATTTENTGRGMSITLLYLDEFAFVRPTIAEQFWTSITPTLSTGGKAIITSTPNSDEDQFALIWKGANKTEDEFGNITKVGVNGFKAYRADWREQPGRDEKWAEEMKSQLGQDRFNREINCLAGSTNVTVKNKAGEIRTMSIDDLTALLNS